MNHTITQDFFLGRQSILDRNQNLAGFELLFRSGQKNAAQFQDDLAATATVINHAFNELGLQTVLGKYCGFINVNEQLLRDDMIELLPKNQVVLELLETVTINEAVVERCKKLKSQGFQLALDDFSECEERFKPLLSVVDIIKVDLTQMEEAKLSKTVAQLKKWPVKLLAEKVDRKEQAQHCRELGFDLFQGYYFAKPLIITGKRLSHSELQLVRLLGLVVSDAPNEDIEQVFKQNPGLTVNLLRLTNSAATGVQQRVSSIGLAIAVLGRRQLQRWLQLLLFASNTPSDAFPSPLLQLAATRGKLMDSLAHHVAPNDKQFQDQAFMVGIVSLMDTLLSMPLQEILAPLHVSQEVSDAVLRREGKLGKMLLLLERLEAGEMEQVAALLQELLPPYSAEQLNAALAEAMGWANSIGDEGG